MDAPEKLPARFGAFVLMRLLGVGGMGRAYLARHPDWKSGLVVKRMHPQYLEDPVVFRRFVHEAKVATFVRHPNVAPLVAMGQVGEEPFIATEFVFGISVSTIVHRVQSSKIGPVPYGVALKLAIDLCRGIEAIHEACDVETGASLDLIHRDIGARNVLIGFDGRIRVIDLGLGKSIFSDWHTAANTFAGSPDYMPPEQALGQPVDRRADVYAAAVTIWELVVGKKRIQEEAIAARIAAAIEAHAEQLVRHRPDASVQLEDVLKRAMAREVAVRTPSISILREELERELMKRAPSTRRQDVVEWLDVACATIIAKDRRTLDDAEAAAAPLLELGAPREVGHTQFFAAQPVFFMPPVEVREESDLRSPPEESSGLARVVSASQKAALRGTEVVTVATRWFARQSKAQQVALIAGPLLLAALLLIVAIAARPAPRASVESISVAAPPPPTSVVVEPPPAEPEPTEPDPLADEPELVPDAPSETPRKEAHRLPSNLEEKKSALVVRIRKLRQKRFDVAWQRRITGLGAALTRARTLAAFERVEGQIEAMEKEAW